MRVIVFAEEAAGARVLRTLNQRAEDVVAVVTTSGDTADAPFSVARVAESFGYRVIPAGTWPARDLVSLIEREKVEVLLNVHSLSVLPGAVVSAPRIGSFNLHPGALPGFAGLNAPSWAVYLGAGEHAVTLHWMLEGIDTGPIVFAESFPLTAQDTGFSVSAKCVTLGVPLVERLLDVAAASPDLIPREKQQGERRFFKRSQVPNRGWIDWDMSAEKIDAFVRAADYGPFVSPWGAPRFLLNGETFSVLRTQVEGNLAGECGRVIAVQEGDALVAAADGTVRLKKLSVAGRIVDAGEVLSVGQSLKSASDAATEDYSVSGES